MVLICLLKEFILKMTKQLEGLTMTIKRKFRKYRKLGFKRTRLTAAQRARIHKIADEHQVGGYPPLVAFYEAVERVGYPTKKNFEYPAHIHRAAERWVKPLLGDGYS